MSLCGLHLGLGFLSLSSPCGRQGFASRVEIRSTGSKKPSKVILQTTPVSTLPIQSIQREWVTRKVFKIAFLKSFFCTEDLRGNLKRTLVKLVSGLHSRSLSSVTQDSVMVAWAQLGKNSDSQSSGCRLFNENSKSQGKIFRHLLLRFLYSWDSLTLLRFQLRPNLLSPVKVHCLHRQRS